MCYLVELGYKHYELARGSQCRKRWQDDRQLEELVESIINEV